MIYLSGGLPRCYVNTQPFPCVATTDISDGNWHHVAITISGTEGKIYIDGVLEDTAAVGVPLSTTARFAIGAYNVGTEKLEGMYYGGKVHGRALTQDEITHLATHGASGTDPTRTDLLAEWNIDSGSGLTIEDTSESGFDLTVSGATSDQFWGTIIPVNLDGSSAVGRSSPTYSGRAKKQAKLERGPCVELHGAESGAITNTDDFSASDWTLSGYFVADDFVGNTALFSQLDGAGTGESWLRLANSTGAWQTELGGTTAGFSITNAVAGVPYYVVFSRDDTADEVTLTVTNLTSNTTESDTVSRTMASATGNFNIGSSKAPSDFLDGQLWGLKLDHANGFELPMQETRGLISYDVSGNGKDAVWTSTITRPNAAEGYFWNQNKGCGQYELITNGTFDSDISGWTDKSAGSTYSEWASSRLSLVGDGASFVAAEQVLTTVAGCAYTVTYDRVGGSGEVNCWIGTTSGGFNLLNQSSTTPDSSFSLSFTAISTTSYIRFRHGSSSTNGIDNVSVKPTALIPALAAGVNDANGYPLNSPAGPYLLDDGSTLSHTTTELSENATWLDDMWQGWAEFNGASSQIDSITGKNLILNAGSVWEVSLDVNIPSGSLSWQPMFMFGATFGVRPSVMIYATGSRYARFYIEGEPDQDVLLSVASITADSWFKLRYGFNGSTYFMFLNDTQVIDLTPSTNPPTYTRDTAWRIGTSTTYHSASSKKNLKVTIDGDVKIDMPLAKNCLDLSGNANHGTPTDVTFSRLLYDPNWVGAEFNGTTSYISLGDDDRFSFGDAATDSPFSVEATIKADSIGAGKSGIVSKATATTADNTEWVFNLSDTGNVQWYLYDSTGGVNISATADAALNTGQEYQILCTYDGSGLDTGLKIYVDGVEVAATGATNGLYTAMHATATPVEIGMSYRINSARYFDGMIKDVRLYDTECTPTSKAGLIFDLPLLENSDDVHGNFNGTDTAITYSEVNVVDHYFDDTKASPQSIGDNNNKLISFEI